MTIQQIDTLKNVRVGNHTISIVCSSSFSIYDISTKIYIHNSHTISNFTPDVPMFMAATNKSCHTFFGKGLRWKFVVGSSTFECRYFCWLHRWWWWCCCCYSIRSFCVRLNVILARGNLNSHSIVMIYDMKKNDRIKEFVQPFYFFNGTCDSMERYLLMQTLHTKLVIFKIRII